MKNICFVIHNIQCGGGTERVCATIANELCNRGYNISIISYDAKKAPFFRFDPKIKIGNMLTNILERRTRRFKWYAAWKLKRFLLANKVDLVIDVDTIHALWTYRAIKNTNIKWISWDHFNFTYCTKSFERMQALQLIEMYANKLVLLSKADKQTYLEETNIPENKIIQIYNPLSFEAESYQERNKKQVLAIGRISYQKGFDLLLQAWKIVETKINDWHLEIVCGYGDYHALEEEAHSMGIKNITCSPPTNNVQGKFEGSSIFVLSSRFEGFGLVLTEAMTMSVPCVSFDCPVGPNEIIINNENGLLAKPEDVNDLAEKLIYMIKNKDERIRMGKNAYESSKRFSIDTIIPQWIKLIDNL